MASFIPSLRAAENCYLLLADLHLNPSLSVPMPFTPKQKGTDLDLESYQVIKKAVLASKQYQEAMGMIILGDVVGHGVSVDKRIEILSQIFSDFGKLKKPSYFVFGNNDSPQGNYQAFDGKNGSSYLIAKNQWPQAMTGFSSSTAVQRCYPNQTQHYPCLIDEDPQQGHFSFELAKGLVLVAINSVLLNGDHIENYQDTADMALAWLQSQLEQSAKQRQQVLLAMHVPPGVNLYSNQYHFREKQTKLPNYQQKFLSVLNHADKDKNFSLLALLGSHTHHDETHLIELHNQIVPVFIVPGISTSHGNAPAFGNICLSEVQGRWQLARTKNAYINSDSTIHPYESVLTNCKKAGASSNECFQQWLIRPELFAKLVEQNYYAANPNHLLDLQIHPERLITRKTD